MLKRHRDLWYWTLACLPIVLSFGCAGTTTWKHVRNASEYQTPKSIAVAILAETGGEGFDEALAVFRKTLVDELKSSGIATTFVGKPTATNGAELRIVQWNPGSRWERYWMNKEGQGYMLVHVKITSGEGRPGFSGVVRGHVDGGAYGGSHLDAAAAAATGIAKAIATGKAEQAPEQ